MPFVNYSMYFRSCTWQKPLSSCSCCQFFCTGRHVSIRCWLWHPSRHQTVPLYLLLQYFAVSRYKAWRRGRRNEELLMKMSRQSGGPWEGRLATRVLRTNPPENWWLGTSSLSWKRHIRRVSSICYIAACGKDTRNVAVKFQHTRILDMLADLWSRLLSVMSVDTLTRLVSWAL